MPIASALIAEKPKSQTTSKQKPQPKKAVVN
jgi:hypothetical protein